jgi:hypothetical protein
MVELVDVVPPGVGGVAIVCATAGATENEATPTSRVVIAALSIVAL